MVLINRALTEDEMQTLMEAAADSDYVGVFDENNQCVAVFQDPTVARAIQNGLGNNNEVPLAVLF